MKHIAELALGGFITDNFHHEWIDSMMKQRDSSILSLVKDKTILTGVLISGNPSIATDGVVVYNGKIYSFIGGEVQTEVTIKRVATDRPNANGIPAAAYYEDVIEFGNDGIETFNFSELKRFYQNQPELKEIKIIARNITNTDLAGTGWFVADGTNGTNDLRNRFFVVAGGEYNEGDTGGSKEVTLTEQQIPAHNHNGTVESPAESASSGTDIHFNIDGNNRQNITKSLTIENAGGGQAHENRPPYYAVVAIQFIGI
tara:strand:- start:1272 stop:2042 length:771 start_codon:yes stop_codon:yes gene_type:complete